MANESNDRETKCEKLYGWENWPQWADLSQAVLEEKEIWDIVNGIRVESTTEAQTRIKEKNNTEAFKMIKEDVNSDLYINIIGQRN